MKSNLALIPDSPVPEAISRLEDLAFNLWWSWNPNAEKLFRVIDPDLWEDTRHNPVRLICETPRSNLQQLAGRKHFKDLYSEVLSEFDAYMGDQDSWFRSNYPDFSGRIAYFCAEFGLHVSLPIYSGGLGILAGDTCKEASDLGVPLVGVGLLYHEGYFHQMVDQAGQQQSLYPPLLVKNTPLVSARDLSGRPLQVEVPIFGTQVRFAVWHLQVGRVPVYLLDAKLKENDLDVQGLSSRLYQGDNSVRLKQEIALGLGGLRLLQSLQKPISLYHLNEGHAAFMPLGLLREFLSDGLPLAEAIKQVQEKTVFTTHTPVRAGHDEFPPDMVADALPEVLGEDEEIRSALLSLANFPDRGGFGMTPLALRLSGAANGVSKKHGQVSRQMWQGLWPEGTVDEVPIRHTTNGVHLPTWMASELMRLLSRHWGRDWVQEHDVPELVDRILDLPDSALWQVHTMLKSKLLRMIRTEIRKRWLTDQATSDQMAAFGCFLEADYLTICFARRFAAYKRGNLIFEDPERLRRILCHPTMPVQLIFSGKAHPADGPGQEILQDVFRACQSREFGTRIAFVENYDQYSAGFLVQGVDVWLNNPIPPKEASGTSGQKAAMNGVLNLSVLDGWWLEAFNKTNGWAIDPQTGEDNRATANAIYELLEEEIVPLYYRRDFDQVPRRWIAKMKASMRSSIADYSARRMLKDNLQNLYSLE